ncbi:hypothetical protein DPMN_019689 [Dreissena polymorpha]|uniref:Uncharacterized protein n=1 Tax=Dreissena polymorpha TaxID=45954 RepID=A0A9D4NKV6_DREPO|nr:hypothetical protein DPMN_019689 [Dreissena polymorpha]
MELPPLTMASDARPEWAGAGGHRARAHKDRVRHTGTYRSHSSDFVLNCKITPYLKISYEIFDTTEGLSSNKTRLNCVGGNDLSVNEPRDVTNVSRNRLGEATLESLIRLCLHTERLGEEEVTRIIDKFAEKPRNVEL